MNASQRDRLLALSHEAAALVVELQLERASSDDKARIRGVLRHLEEATYCLSKAVERAEGN